MGYSTDFSGQFEIDRAVDAETKRLLVGLNETRRMARNVDELVYGIEGEFYFGPGMSGQDEEENIINYNQPPKTQPGLWCGWQLTDDDQGIAWDGGEKFYNYVEWLQYLIDKVLAPRGYTLNGEVYWYGDDRDDLGIIDVVDNVLTVRRGSITYQQEG